MREHFQKELNRLLQQIEALGNRVIYNIDMAAEAITNADLELVKNVLASEEAVDESEVGIEEECLKVIALNQPVADDLRLLMTIIRADRDLERISDMAADIAKGARRVTLSEVTPYKDALLEMGGLVRRILEMSLASLLERDGEMARQTWLFDKKINEMRNTLSKKLREDILAGGGDQTRFELIDAVNHFERMGDHAANTAKAVLYLVLGEIVRHRGSEFKHSEILK